MRKLKPFFPPRNLCVPFFSVFENLNFSNGSLSTSNGELWIGRDEDARWSNIARHLPEIYAVEVVELP